MSLFGGFFRKKESEINDQVIVLYLRNTLQSTVVTGPGKQAAGPKCLHHCGSSWVEVALGLVSAALLGISRMIGREGTAGHQPSPTA